MPRRKHVKLEVSNAIKFANTFGKKGQTFEVGLFNKKSATKGALLEFGSKNQAARPWLSVFGLPGTETQKRLEKILAEYVKDTLAGEDSKKETANKIKELARNFVRLQDFPSASSKPLKDSTIDKKRRSGSTTPSLVGIDTQAMINMIKVRTRGGSRRKLKKKR